MDNTRTTSLTHLAFLMAERTEFATLAHLVPAPPLPARPQAVCTIHTAAREASLQQIAKGTPQLPRMVCHLLDRIGQKCHVALKRTHECTSSSPVLCGNHCGNGAEQEKEIWGRVKDRSLSLRS